MEGLTIYFERRIRDFTWAIPPGGWNTLPSLCLAKVILLLPSLQSQGVSVLNWLSNGHQNDSLGLRLHLERVALSNHFFVTLMIFYSESKSTFSISVNLTSNNIFEIH